MMSKKLINFFLITIFICICYSTYSSIVDPSTELTLNEQNENTYIKWVDFNVPYSALERALKHDIESYNTTQEVNWIEILAYLSAKYGNNFSRYKSKDMDHLIEELKNGKTIDELTVNMKYYDYYNEAYTTILGEFVGEYSIEVTDPKNPDNKVLEKKYGLKVFSPIAKGYYFSHYDDFGNSRSYGFSRKHLGNDLIASVGTPVIAVESGIVEALGWNRYGGWRIGIRSFDGKRYYYYAHLRKNYPFHKSLSEGKIVKAGDVIGYVGMTGYSTKENVNNIRTPHLHFGLQLIFDESQKEGVNEIWIDVYHIVRLLQCNRSAVYKNQETGDFERIYDMDLPLWE